MDTIKNVINNVEIKDSFKRIDVSMASSYEGVRFSMSRVGNTQTSETGGIFVGNKSENGYFTIQNVDFKDGANFVEARVSGGTNNTVIDIHIDSLDGEKIASFTAFGRYYSSNWGSDFGEVKKTVGIHDLYVKLTPTAEQTTCNVSDIRFYKEKPNEMEKYDTYFQNENTNLNFRDVFADTWVAVDDLGREMPTNITAGDIKLNKTVAFFYFMCHGNKKLNKYQRVYDVTKILKTDPSNDEEKGFGPMWCEHYWGEPYFGYYTNEDVWVIRKHMQMLSDAGVDVIFIDYTNSISYDADLIVLLKTMAQMRREGLKTPQFSFMSSGSSDLINRFIKHMYDEIYKNAYYKDLWFYWQGKPLVLALTDPQNLDEELQEFFTYRKSWAWSGMEWFGDGKDAWTWTDHHPQKYGWNKEPEIPEHISVSIAQHATTSIGRSFNNKSEPPEDDEQTSLGLNFKEQWERALEVNPEIVFITGWNEWVQPRQFFENQYPGESAIFAGKQINKKDRSAVFVDCYNMEFSRDAEPMRGGFGDNYYYQTVNYIRRYKGVRPQFKASEKITITNFKQWKSVKPEFRDHLYDTTWRSNISHDKAIYYVNKTGRNDLDIAKVARDDEFIYFYVRTREDITKPTDENWMTLYLNINMDYTDGWYGYDYVVNRKTGILEKFIGGWNFEKVADIVYEVKGNEMQLKVPKKFIGLGSEEFTIDFKWADNCDTKGDIMAFMDKGDAAPSARFNFRYTECTKNVIEQQLDQNEIKPIVKIQNPKPNIAKDLLRNLIILNTKDGKSYSYGEEININIKTCGKETYINFEDFEKIFNSSPEDDIKALVENGEISVRKIAYLLKLSVMLDDRGLILIGKTQNDFMLVKTENVVDELIRY